ncbi:cation-transporting P-type ATPase [Nocardia sp. NPDC050193]
MPFVAESAAPPEQMRSEAVVDPREPVSALMRDLRTGPEGLTSREAARRLELYGSNELPLRRGQPWWVALGRQFGHPLALLLWVAAALALGSGAVALGLAILVVIVLNAVLAFWQESQAEHAVRALGRFLPARVSAVRDGTRTEVPAGQLVRGDILVLEEGERIPADARMIDGRVEVDMSALTGESEILDRSAGATDHADRSLDSPVLVFSGTACVGGSGRALVHGTGVHTELGRIAALSQHVRPEESPLEPRMRRVAWLIAAVAVGAGAAFHLLRALLDDYAGSHRQWDLDPGHGVVAIQGIFADESEQRVVAAMARTVAGVGEVRIMDTPAGRSPAAISFRRCSTTPGPPAVSRWPPPPPVPAPSPRSPGP